jgi:methionyl-tRNA formyltransferase
MRVVFLGTPIFAVPALRMLIDQSYEVCGVFTQPDRPSGRGHQLHPSPIKTLALECGIPVFQPDKIRNEENRTVVEAFNPDFLVVAAYGQILPKWLLQSARLAPVNLHASLLPCYRGASPIPWAILNGDSISGITTMLMEETLDSGAILMQQEVPISLTMTAGELAEKLSAMGANLLIKTLEGMQNGTIDPIPQDENRVSWTSRISKEMALVSWEKAAMDIHNRVRAMNPWPVAYTSFRDERLQLWRSLPADSIAQAEPGTFLGLSADGILIQCGSGSVLDVIELQRPGKGRVNGREFASGARLRAGERIFY